MDVDPKTFRTLMGLPARLNMNQVAAVLGFQPHDIPVLVAAGLLSPLGRRDQANNTTKYFAAVDIEERRADAKWLNRATDAVQNRWAQRRKNEARMRASAGPRGRGYPDRPPASPLNRPPRDAVVPSRTPEPVRPDALVVPG